MSIRPFMTQQSARRLRLAAPARVLSWVGTLVPSQSSPRVAKPVAVKSWTGCETRVHAVENHGSWLHIALFLDGIATKAAAGRGGSPLAGGSTAEGAQVSVPPDGNHGVNKSLPFTTPGEFTR